MCAVGMWRLVTVVALAAGTATSVVAQEPEPTTRQAAIEQAQAEKVKTLHPYVPGKVEGLLNRAEDILVNGVPRWHPFFENADYGGGFTLGVGYAHHVSSYDLVDVRGSYTILGYKRIEAEFTAPRLFHRRGALSVVGGWREATQAAFYGLGMGTSKDDRTDFDFKQPYGSGILTFWPTRRLLMLRGGLEPSQWKLQPAEGDFPSVETVYTPATLPGLQTKTTYLHSQGTAGLDGEPLRGIPGAAASTASRCTITPTRTSSSASGRSTTKRSSTFRSCAKPGSSRSAASRGPHTARPISRCPSS